MPSVGRYAVGRTSGPSGLRFSRAWRIGLAGCRSDASVCLSVSVLPVRARACGHSTCRRHVLNTFCPCVRVRAFVWSVGPMRVRFTSGLPRVCLVFRPRADVRAYALPGLCLPFGVRLLCNVQPMRVSVRLPACPCRCSTGCPGRFTTGLLALYPPFYPRLWPFASGLTWLFPAFDPRFSAKNKHSFSGRGGRGGRPGPHVLCRGGSTSKGTPKNSCANMVVAMYREAFLFALTEVVRHIRGGSARESRRLPKKAADLRAEWTNAEKGASIHLLSLIHKRGLAKAVLSTVWT